MPDSLPQVPWMWAQTGGQGGLQLVQLLLMAQLLGFQCLEPVDGWAQLASEHWQQLLVAGAALG